MLHLAVMARTVPPDHQSSYSCCSLCLLPQVQRSRSFAEQAKEDIYEAHIKQKNTRKWQLWCCIVLTLILVIVAAVVAVEVVKMRNRARAAEQAANSGRRLLQLMLMPEQ